MSTSKAEPPFLKQGSLRLDRNLVSKKFCGDVYGASEGQMITAYTDIPGSAGYVAIEHLTGVGGVLLRDSVSDLAQVAGGPGVPDLSGFQVAWWVMWPKKNANNARRSAGLSQRATVAPYFSISPTNIWLTESLASGLPYRQRYIRNTVSNWSSRNQME